jgi:hypothetical protein
LAAATVESICGQVQGRVTEDKLNSLDLSRTRGKLPAPGSVFLRVSNPETPNIDKFNVQLQCTNGPTAIIPTYLSPSA